MTYARLGLTLALALLATASALAQNESPAPTRRIGKLAAVFSGPVNDAGWT